MYYLTRPNLTQKWKVTTTEGPRTHPESFEDHQSACDVRTALNAAIEAERKAKIAPVGRRPLPEAEKAKRVFFTLRPETWKVISPEGDAAALKTFAKEAIREKLSRDIK